MSFCLAYYSMGITSNHMIHGLLKSQDNVVYWKKKFKTTGYVIIPHQSNLSKTHKHLSSFLSHCTNCHFWLLAKNFWKGCIIINLMTVIGILISLLQMFKVMLSLLWHPHMFMSNEPAYHDQTDIFPSCSHKWSFWHDLVHCLFNVSDSDYPTSPSLGQVLCYPEPIRATVVWLAETSRRS